VKNNEENVTRKYLLKVKIIHNKGSQITRKLHILTRCRVPFGNVIQQKSTWSTYKAASEIPYSVSKLLSWLADSGLKLSSHLYLQERHILLLGLFSFLSAPINRSLRFTFRRQPVRISHLQFLTGVVKSVLTFLHASDYLKTGHRLCTLHLSKQIGTECTFVPIFLSTWPASWSNGQSFWLLIMRSRVRVPVLPWWFLLEEEDLHGDHGLGSLVEFKFKAPPGASRGPGVA
jgi:hypothetical protein